jgi:hypothetical protein
VALLGVVSTRWNSARLLVGAFAAYATLVVLPFPIVTRYRLPIVMAGIPFAAAWLARSETTAGRLRGWRALLACVLAAAFVALSLIHGVDAVLPLLSQSTSA